MQMQGCTPTRPVKVNWPTPGSGTWAAYPKGAAGFAIVKEESSRVNTGRSWARGEEILDDIFGAPRYSRAWTNDIFR